MTHLPPQYVSGLNQFPGGHSPVNSPLSPGAYGGDDYFTSRQVSPGPAASPGGASKIKSRPRPSATGPRISQGGIKALFTQSIPKSNRASLDSKTESALLLGAAATTPLKKKLPVKSLSAEIPPVSNQMLDAVVGVAADRSIQGPSTPTSETPPTLTLAERRAAAAAAAAASTGGNNNALSQRRASLQKQASLIPPNLGLDSQANRFILPPNLTPGSETGPLTSPAILTATSPAPIQIGRVIPRNSSSQARTEEQQRRLDEAMERVNFEDVTVAELKEMLRQRGKHGGGKKADLIKRLQAEIDVIRANRNGTTRNNATSSPMPISTTPSSTSSLQRTMGNLHIGSPPVHSSLASSPSTRRYTPYAAPLPSPGGTVQFATSPVAGPGVPVPPPSPGLPVHVNPANGPDNAASGAATGMAGPTSSGSNSSVGTGHANTLSVSGATHNGREAVAVPGSSPRMASMLGSSFISSDGTVHQNPTHPHYQRYHTPAPGSMGRKSPLSNHSSPAESSLRHSHSPESSALEDTELQTYYQDMHQKAGEDSVAESMSGSEVLFTSGQGYPLNTVLHDGHHNGSIEQRDTFSLQPQMDMSTMSPSPSPAPMSASHDVDLQQGYSGYGNTGYEHGSSHGQPLDDANNADIKQAEDEFLALSPQLGSEHLVDHLQSPQHQHQHQQMFKAQSFNVQDQQHEDQKQEALFEYDPTFADGTVQHHQPHQSLSQDDLDLLLNGQQEDMSFQQLGAHFKDGYW